METSNKQTPVDWLIAQLTESGHLWITDKPDDMNELSLIIEKAKQMEKEQIVDAFGKERHYTNNDGYHKIINSKQYYNETYGK